MVAPARRGVTEAASNGRFGGLQALQDLFFSHSGRFGGSQTLQESSFLAAVCDAQWAPGRTRRPEKSMCGEGCTFSAPLYVSPQIVNTKITQCEKYHWISRSTRLCYRQIERSHG